MGPGVTGADGVPGGCVDGRRQCTRAARVLLPGGRRRSSQPARWRPRPWTTGMRPAGRWRTCADSNAFDAPWRAGTPRAAPRTAHQGCSCGGAGCAGGATCSCVARGRCSGCQAAVAPGLVKSPPPAQPRGVQGAAPRAGLAARMRACVEAAVSVPCGGNGRPRVPLQDARRAATRAPQPPRERPGARPACEAQAPASAIAPAGWLHPHMLSSGPHVARERPRRHTSSEQRATLAHAARGARWR